MAVAAGELDVGRLRAEVDAEWGIWSAAEAGRRIGSRGHSPTAAIRRWAAQGRLLAVPVAGSDHHPGFCFGPDGRPRPAIAEVAAALGPDRRGWALLAWWVAPHPALGGARPVDRLEADPGSVVAAAHATAQGQAQGSEPQRGQPGPEV